MVTDGTASETVAKARRKEIGNCMVLYGVSYYGYETTPTDESEAAL